jgi:putrescine importer
LSDEAVQGVTSTEQTALKRTLGLRSVVLFGLAYMAPLIVLGTFGVVAERTQGATPSAYLLAMVAMLFTAFSYGRLAHEFPVAGSAYTYVRRVIDDRLGFLIGWAILLDYFFLPMVIWLIGGAYLSAEIPAVPGWVWIVGFIVVTTCLNIAGIRVAEKANWFLMALQFTALFLFVGFSVAYLTTKGGFRALESLTPFWNSSTTVATVAAGAAVAAYSFLGFDAVTTLTEEAIEPKKTIPRAIILTALVGGALYVTVSYTTQLVHPGGTFKNADSAAFEIALTIGGNLFAAIFLAGLVVTQFAAGLAAQASTSRLLYAMGRDGVLPRRIFGVLSPRFQTPIGGILLTGLVGLLALKMDLATSTSFINFGAFTAFTFVNLACAKLWLDNRERSRFHYLYLPLVGAVVDLWLLTSLDKDALIVGGVWLGLGIIVLGFLTRGFRQRTPDMHTAHD